MIKEMVWCRVVYQRSTYNNNWPNRARQSSHCTYHWRHEHVWDHHAQHLQSLSSACLASPSSKAIHRRPTHESCTSRSCPGPTLHPWRTSEAIWCSRCCYCCCSAETLLMCRNCCCCGHASFTKSGGNGLTRGFYRKGSAALLTVWFIVGEIIDFSSLLRFDFVLAMRRLINRFRPNSKFTTVNSTLWWRIHARRHEQSNIY